MITSTKKWLLAAMLLIIVGITVIGLCACSAGFDLDNFSTSKYETSVTDITEKFENIEINSDVADIKFIKSEDDTCKVVCYNQEKEKHTVIATGGTLKITYSPEKKWYEYIGINLNSPSITVYLPEDEYSSVVIDESTGDINIPSNFKFNSLDLSLSTGDVVLGASTEQLCKISLSTGDLTVKDAHVGSLDISLSTGDVDISDTSITDSFTISLTTGDVTLTNVTCKDFTSTATAGDLSLCSVVSSGKISVVTTTGNVILSASDAEELIIETSTGDVTGTLLSEKIFISSTSTGKIDIPKTASGGICEITTSTGDIKISIAK